MYYVNCYHLKRRKPSLTSSGCSPTNPRRYLLKSKRKLAGIMSRRSGRSWASRILLRRLAGSAGLVQLR
jgi:hypothetical protein